jgi:transcriptional antiterminator RfaH
MPGAMDFVRFGNSIATIRQDKIEALKLIHHPTIQATVRLELEDISDELLKRIEEIHTAKEPSQRIDLMFSMLTTPKRLIME